MNGIKSFRTGIVETFSRWQVWVPIYLLNFFSAFILILLPAILLIAPAQRPTIRDAASGINGWMILDILMSPLVNQTLDIKETDSIFRQATLIGVITLAIIPTIAGIVNAFVNGGILLAYHERAQAFQWKRFAWGCWHWFGAFLLFGFTQFILALTIFGTLISGAIWLVGLGGEWTTWIVIPILVVLMMLWLGIMELTGAQMIVNSTRNFARAFFQATRYFFRHPLNFIVFYGLNVITLIAAHFAFNALMPYVPLDAFLLVFIIQQVFVIIRLGLRLTRAAGGVVMIGQLS